MLLDGNSLIREGAGFLTYDVLNNITATASLLGPDVHVVSPVSTKLLMSPAPDARFCGIPDIDQRCGHIFMYINSGRSLASDWHVVIDVEKKLCQSRESAHNDVRQLRLLLVAGLSG